MPKVTVQQFTMVDSKNQLAAAAEALVQAAISTTNNTSLTEMSVRLEVLAQKLDTLQLEIQATLKAEVACRHCNGQ
jgi:hypothetical protein